MKRYFIGTTYAVHPDDDKQSAINTFLYTVDDGADADAGVRDLADEQHPGWDILNAQAKEVKQFLPPADAPFLDRAIDTAFAVGGVAAIAAVLIGYVLWASEVVKVTVGGGQ
jgi:hypothetical protein